MASVELPCFYCSLTPVLPYKMYRICEACADMYYSKGKEMNPPEKQEGTKNDTNKTRIELFPGDALFAISDILTFGGRKYGDHNWAKGMSWSRVFGALMRHMWSWWQGKGPTNESFVFGSLDEETKRSHLWHAGCCIVFLISYEMRNIGTDDRPKA